MEDVHRDELGYQQKDNQPFEPGFFQKFPSMQGVEKKDEIFYDVEAKASVDDETDEVFGFQGDVEAVVTNDADNRRQGDDSTAYLHNATHLVLVCRDVQLTFAIIVLFARFPAEHYRLILMKLSISCSLPKSTNTSPS